LVNCQFRWNCLMVFDRKKLTKKVPETACPYTILICRNRHFFVQIFSCFISLSAIRILRKTKLHPANVSNFVVIICQVPSVKSNYPTQMFVFRQRKTLWPIILFSGFYFIRLMLAVNLRLVETRPRDSKLLTVHSLKIRFNTQFPFKIFLVQ